MLRLRSWSQWPLALLAAVAVVLFASRSARAGDEEEPAADEPAAAEPAAAAPDEAKPDEAKPDEAPSTGDEAPAAAADPAGADEAPAAAAAPPGAADVADGDGEPAGAAATDEIPPELEYDSDGDGQVEAGEAELAKEYGQAYAGIDEEIKPVEPGTMDFEEMARTAMSSEEFRTLVRLAKAKVLDRLQTKMAKKQDERMAKISTFIALFSLSGVLLLATPLFLRKKYPGQGALLFKYSGLAAITFILTVNFFGGVVLAMRGAQGALGELTNPQLKVAEGFFDALDDKADQYRLLGNLFGPTLKGLSAGGEAGQPAVALLENGQKLVQDAKVFITAAKAFKRIDFVFAILPIVLLGVTMLLFIIAIKPTLIEIIKMPAQVASGTASAGKDAVKNAGRRIVGELLATLATVGVLAVLTLLGAVILSRLLPVALDTLIQFFGTSIIYLQVEQGASSGLIFVALFSVIFFLVLNLAALILSTVFFLGKSQKIFQQRFNEKVPLAAHKRFWTWGTASLLVAQLIPLVYMFAAWEVIDWLANKMIGDDGINWTGLFVGLPALLVGGFIIVFWAARGVKAIKFLATYKVKDALPKAAPATADASQRVAA